MDATRRHIVIDGNTASALGCVYAGATVGAWYPITPSTSLMDAFRAFCAQYRIDPETGKRTYAIIQAEDELAAIGMVLGASWMGARSFTPTSGPGISLMSEFIGYAYYAEIPAVIFNVQRTGPSTGMPTRTQQSDILSCAYASHGDTKHVLLFPADPHECFTMAPQAFDLADRLQTPVMVLSDLDIGMNDWMVPEFEWDESYVHDRGKVLSADDLEEMDTFYRYLDVDGDGIPYRTLPGTHPKGSYFTRGSGHTKYGAYTENATDYQEVVDRLMVKWETARQLVPEPEIAYSKFNNAAILTVGSGNGACKEALDRLGEQNVGLNYCRVKAFPFSDSIREFIDKHEVVYVVEQNRDAQLRALADPRTQPAAGQAGAAAALQWRAHECRFRRRESPRRNCQRSRRMSYIAKPQVSHPSLRKNKLGLTFRDYEGSVSTLCAGCGHDSVTAAIVQAVFELDIEPHMLAKMSGIGCSSKTPAYFVQQSHGFNSVHGRMPSVTTGANTANRHLMYIGVSGDGDSLSIGVGQFVHAIRRNLNMCYIIENNGVYGLTKGQFSASADIGSKPKKG